VVFWRIRYDPTTFAPSWIVRAPCIQLGVDAAVNRWVKGLARDESVTRSHFSYSLVCSDPCLGCPVEVRDLLSRNKVYMLWGWQPPAHPAHAWASSSTANEGAALRKGVNVDCPQMEGCLPEACGTASSQDVQIGRAKES
jgi:hypothetical protein